MSTFQIVLLVFLGIVGFLPGLFDLKREHKTRKEKIKYRLRTLGIPLLVALAIILHSVIENKKTKQAELKQLEEKSFGTDATKLISEITTSLSQLQTDYSFIESSDQIISDAQSTINSVTELRSMPGQENSYKGYISENKKKIDDYTRQRAQIQKKIDSIDGFELVKNRCKEYAELVEIDAKILTDKVEKFEVLLKDGYNSNYMSLNTIYIDLNKILSDSYNDKFESKFLKTD